MDSYDVIVVGSGPVGMATAGLLASRGISVAVIERYSGLYNLPRAANFDGETMRTFDRLNIAERLLPQLYFQPLYEWRNGEGELLLEIRYDDPGDSGWAEFYQMYQPDVEDALFDAARSAGAQFRFGVEVTGYEQLDDRVDVLTTAGPLRATYVIACDGGNGMTREAIGAEIVDLGFSEPWLVCDFEYPTEQRTVPRALQVGDPAQPVSIIALGRRHQRFSFMLDSAEDFEHEREPELVWRRVAHYLRPNEAELIRVATYTFRSRLATVWRRGRLLLAGDAAHQMPPFLGQGMVSGIRDAQNLAFKLELVLSGRSPDSLLDTYQSERYPHVEEIIRRGVELGRLQTVRDPRAAAERDSRMRHERERSTHPQKPGFPPLGDGLLATTEGPARGRIMPHGRVARDGEAVLLDRVTGSRSFVLITQDRSPLGESPHPLVTPIRVGADALQDIDGVYTRWFEEYGVSSVLVRPDGYIFGTAVEGAIPALLEELERAVLRPSP